MHYGFPFSYHHYYYGHRSADGVCGPRFCQCMNFVAFCLFRHFAADFKATFTTASELSVTTTDAERKLVILY